MSVSNSARRRRATNHVIQRARERAGIALTAEDVLCINQKIWRGEAIEFGKQKRKGKTFLVTIDGGCTLSVVFHTGWHWTVTVLRQERDHEILDRYPRHLAFGQPASPC